jgi:hypothetical protein
LAWLPALICDLDARSSIAGHARGRLFDDQPAMPFDG